MINSKIQNPGGLSGQGQFPGLIQNHTIGLFSYSKSISFPVIGCARLVGKKSQCLSFCGWVLAHKYVSSPLRRWVLCVHYACSTKYTSQAMMLWLTWNPGSTTRPTLELGVMSSGGPADCILWWSNGNPFSTTNVVAGVLKAKASLCTSHTETASLQKLS